jgi:hypothetical protein
MMRVIKDNSERTKENSKKPSQRGGDDRNQRAIVGNIKKRMNEAITKPNIDGDPTRSGE